MLKGITYNALFQGWISGNVATIDLNKTAHFVAAVLLRPLDKEYDVDVGFSSNNPESHIVHKPSPRLTPTGLDNHRRMILTIGPKEEIRFLTRVLVLSRKACSHF